MALPFQGWGVKAQRHPQLAEASQGCRGTRADTVRLMAEPTLLTLRRAGESSPTPMSSQHSPPASPVPGHPPTSQLFPLIPTAEAALTELAVLSHVQLDDAIGDGGGSRDLQHHVGVFDNVPIFLCGHL